ncbi:hypothetical protein Bca4012_026502 [Brassica carinata]
MAHLKQRCSYLLDDGPCSRVRGEDLVEIRRRYMIPPSAGIRNHSDFDRGPGGGVNEMAIYEAYLEAGIVMVFSCRVVLVVRNTRRFV